MKYNKYLQILSDSHLLGEKEFIMTGLFIARGFFLITVEKGGNEELWKSYLYFRFLYRF